LEIFLGDYGMRSKKGIFMWLIVCMIITLCGAPGFSTGNAGGKGTGTAKTGRSFVITYFHNTFRCPTCHDLEKFSQEAVQSHFGETLKKGALVWRTIDVDEPENQHFNTDYQLFTKSLILSEMKDGKEVRWKNIDKIWELVGNEDAFKAYVASEIAAWVKEQ
jgi:hypothetical protein